MPFHAFKLHPSLISAVDAAGYKTPTPIQQQSIPHAIEGKDVMGLAQTGTGKTAAFVLPIINRLLATNKGARHVRALVIAPTRELAEPMNSCFIHAALREVPCCGSPIWRMPSAWLC